MSAVHVCLRLAVVAITAVAMELWACQLHQRFWHRALWPLHRSHHQPHAGRLEANDWLSLLHAPPAVLLILYGCLAASAWTRDFAFGIGIGMSVFGVAYFVVHDGFIHGRLPLAFLRRSRTFVRLRALHRVHHRRDAAPYGLFLAAWELRAHARSSRASRLSPDAQDTAAGTPSARCTDR